jgi:hypothetical protein
MKRSVLSPTSLAMCTSAARSTAHVLEIAMLRGTALCATTYVSLHRFGHGEGDELYRQIAAFAAALALLHAHWAHQSSDSTFDSKTTMELVRKLFITLKDGERKWHIAGRFV